MSGPMFNFSGCQFNQHKEPEYHAPVKDSHSSSGPGSTMSLENFFVLLLCGALAAVIVAPRASVIMSPAPTTTIINNK